MIQVFTGDNSFVILQKINKIKQKLNLDLDEIDVVNITAGAFLDKILAQSLFSTEQLILARDLSQNKLVWQALTDKIDQVVADEDLHLILIENSLDKRTKLAKYLLKNKLVQDCQLPKQYDQAAAVKFMTDFSDQHQLKLSSKQLKLIFERVGADPWAQAKAIEKLSSLGQTVSDEQIEKYIPKANLTNVFAVFEQIVNNQQQLMTSLEELTSSEVDPHQFFGLISSQFINALALKLAPSNANVATDLGLHPYAASQLQKSIRRIDLAYLKTAVRILAETDLKLKSGSTDTWALISLALLKINQI